MHAPGQMDAAPAGLASGAVKVPSFLIIGAAKAGTTSLNHYLAQHPQIFMSPRKDTFFFDFDGQPPDYGGPGDNAWYRARAVIEGKAYRALFAGVTSEKAVGEACTQYLYDPDAAARIHRDLPQAKLIVVLRDPVERAYSSFLQQVRDGYETTADFAEALALEPQRRRAKWRPMWHYKARGFYFAQLERYLAHFARGRLGIYLYDDLQRDPRRLLREIFDFLEVDPSFTPDISLRHNRAGLPRSRRLHRLIMTPNPLKSLVRPLLPGRLRAMVKAAVTDSRLNLRRPSLPGDLRRGLVADYRDDVLKLQDLIRRDLSGWLA